MIEFLGSDAAWSGRNGLPVADVGARQALAAGDRDRHAAGDRARGDPRPPQARRPPRGVGRQRRPGHPELRDHRPDLPVLAALGVRARPVAHGGGAGAARHPPDLHQHLHRRARRAGRRGRRRPGHGDAARASSCARSSCPSPCRWSSPACGWRRCRWWPRPRSAPSSATATWARRSSRGSSAATRGRCWRPRSRSRSWRCRSTPCSRWPSGGPSAGGARRAARPTRSSSPRPRPGEHQPAGGGRNPRLVR